MDQVTFDHGENGHAVEPLLKLAIEFPLAPRNLRDQGAMLAVRETACESEC